jgi:glycosyltransferase involved in cell wall biosynthesis
MNNDNLLITVIIAVYNGEKTLQQCIDSFYEQDHLQKELIIIDGASKDDTLDIIHANRDKINYFITEPDSGIYDAWNKGLKQVKGEWVCFLGADDFFCESSTLSKMNAALIRIPKNIDVVYGKVNLVNTRGDKLFEIGHPWAEAKLDFKKRMSIPHPGLMHRQTIFKRFGEFDTSFKIAGDYELLLRVLKSGEAIFVNSSVVNMRVGGVSNDPSNNVLSYIECSRALMKNGFPPARFFIASKILSVYIRIWMYKLLGNKHGAALLDWLRKILGKKPYWTKLN